MYITLNHITLEQAMITKLFGHICRMTDSQIQIVGFVIMDGNNKVGRSHREWADDTVDWCRARLRELRYSALDRDN